MLGENDDNLRSKLISIGAPGGLRGPGTDHGPPFFGAAMQIISRVPHEEVTKQRVLQLGWTCLFF